MSTARRQPVRSSLAGASPLAPAPAPSESAELPDPAPTVEPSSQHTPPATPQPVVEPDPAPTAPAAAPTPAPAPTPEPVERETAKPKHPPKTTFYQHVEDRERMRAAFVRVVLPTGVRSLSEYILGLVMADVERLEREHNGGEPFPTVPTNAVPRGRPSSS